MDGGRREWRQGLTPGYKRLVESVRGCKAEATTATTAPKSASMRVRLCYDTTRCKYP
jgi:hypothetical protein